MDNEADRFELELRKRDARKTVVVGMTLLFVTGVLVAIFVAECVVVYVAEAAIRVPVLAFVAPLAAAGMFAILGASSLRDGFRKRRAAGSFETRPTGMPDLFPTPR